MLILLTFGFVQEGVGDLWSSSNGTVRYIVCGGCLHLRSITASVINHACALGTLIVLHVAVQFCARRRYLNSAMHKLFVIEITIKLVGLMIPCYPFMRQTGARIHEVLHLWAQGVSLFLVFSL